MLRLALACLLLAATAPAGVGRFSVAPIRIDFSGAVRIGAVTVTSEDDHPLVFKNSPSVWTQNADGGDVYTPTSDLVVTPPLLRVETGEPRIVRIGTVREPGDVERSYRVFLEEQAPANPDAGGATIAVVIKFGVPVFVAVADPERIAGVAEIVERKPGRITLQVKNTGNVHINVEAITANGVAVKDVSSWYLLPGATRRYDLAIPRDACTGATVDLRIQATRTVLAASAAASDVCQH